LIISKLKSPEPQVIIQESDVFTHAGSECLAFNTKWPKSW